MPPPSRLPSVAWAVALFVAFGLGTEIVFTGVAAGVTGSFRGGVSLLMIPVYAGAYFVVGGVLGLLRRTGRPPLPALLALGVGVVYAVEWSFGSLYAALGLAPWHYEHGWASDFSGGRITLLYAPFWALFVWLAERAWRIATAAGPALDAAARDALRAPRADG